MPVKAFCRYSWRDWKFTSSGEENHSGCWQVLQTQRFTQLIKNKKRKRKTQFLPFFPLASSHLCVYLHRRGSISCQGAKWAAVWPTAPELRVRIQSIRRCPSGIQMSIPLVAWRNLPSAFFFNLPLSLLLVCHLSLTLSLLPPLYPGVCQCWWLAVTLCRSR